MGKTRLAIKEKEEKSYQSINYNFTYILFISFVQSVTSMHKANIAENYITQSEVRLDKINSAITQGSNRLEQNSKLYKEYKLYSDRLDEEKEEYENLTSELEDIKEDFDHKKIKKVLYQFQSEEDGNDTIFSEKVAAMEKSVASFNKKTAEVIEIDKYLISQYPKFNAFKESLDERVKLRYDDLNIIQSKGKNVAVKNNVNMYFTQINDQKKRFINGLEHVKEYTSASQGSLSLNQLRHMKEKYLSQITLLKNVDSSIGTFDGYWGELHEQYYTVVKNHYSTRSTDYVTENNPKYKEWTETETYQDTETYTEKVYVGSRIVDDKKEDIYEDVTKQRPVTKTRTVTKNNGQPVTISVPYDVYTFYYTLEKHTPNGVTKTTKEVGDKHEKYDTSITSWDYNQDEEIGYVEWKQLWDDNSGILRGKNLSPRLE
ncbi:hypothetical protein [Aminipila terrae]|uniref:Uncharacterized protein n=1 Tax=Aminipila terrae TaxID=2697030 RepID=A0A6P1MJD4_9FIRM|nr:hypothetical protein [Aminipila terrae]QHI73851.1 hypothetical protein Ami3637_16975 [Aminipila terrae]